METITPFPLPNIWADMVKLVILDLLEYEVCINGSRKKLNTIKDHKFNIPS